MQFITNKISTGKPGRFEDFVESFKKSKIKTASSQKAVKVAEEDEGKSSGQLDVEPLHQTGESTTMPKAGPSAKKDESSKAAKSGGDTEKEGKDSGQPKAEGSEKLTNDPKVPSKEEKGGSAKVKAKTASTKCEKCGKECEECECEGECKCASCSGNRQTKKAALEDLPEEVQEKITGKKVDKDDDSDEKEEKEASSKGQFVKWANLDSKNKSFLTKYWRQLFGDEYVDALVSDK